MLSFEWFLSDTNCGCPAHLNSGTVRTSQSKAIKCESIHLFLSLSHNKIACNVVLSAYTTLTKQKAYQKQSNKWKIYMWI